MINLSVVTNLIKMIEVSNLTAVSYLLLHSIPPFLIKVIKLTYV